MKRYPISHPVPEGSGSKMPCCVYSQQSVLHGERPGIVGWRRCACGRKRSAATCIPSSCVDAPCPSCTEGCQIFFSVVFNAEGGAPVPPPQLVPSGGKAMRPPDPQRIGYAFEGWYLSIGLSSKLWNFEADIVTQDMTLNARWIPESFTVAFDTNGGMPVPSTQFVPEGGLVTRPTDPFREGYVFIAWYPTPQLIGLPWSFSQNTVTHDMTLYARWLEPA